MSRGAGLRTRTGISAAVPGRGHLRSRINFNVCFVMFLFVFGRLCSRGFGFDERTAHLFGARGPVGQ
jgi:hypothetical protein